MLIARVRFGCNMANDGQRPLEPSEPASRTVASAIEYSIHIAEHLIYMRLGKILTAADIQKYTAALRHDPHFDPTFAEIVDLRKVERMQISPAEAIDLADHADPFAMTSRRAFVTASDLQVNFARMHQMLRSPSDKFGIFDSVEKAEQWVRSPGSSQALKKKAKILPFIPHWFF